MLRKFVSTANTEGTKYLKGCESSDDHRRYAIKLYPRLSPTGETTFPT